MFILKGVDVLAKMSLRMKMALPVVLVSLLFVVILFNVWLAFSNQEESDQLLSREVKPVSVQASEGYRDLYQIMSYATGLVLANGDQALITHYKAEFADEIKKVTRRLNAPQSLIDSGFIGNENNVQMRTLNKNLEQWLSIYSDFFELNGDYQNQLAANKEELDQLLKKTLNAMKSVLEKVESEEAKLEIEKSNNINHTKLVMELGGLIALILSALLTWYLSGLIAAPIKRLNSAMKDISSGEGDLTARVVVETTDEIGQLAGAFNLFVEKIHQTISEVIGASKEVRGEMENMGRVTHTISTGANAQQQDSDAVATAVHEMSATSETVSQNANEAATASQSANDAANNAKLVLGETVLSIQSLSAEIEQAGEVINTLEHDVKDISSILEVIRGIADQTNLLALNAAIEAARAGEQGRGFAVVADEVRSLASKTQNSTGEIQNMIEKLQNGAQQAVKVMASSQTNSGETVQQAEIAGDSLDAIVDSINIINDMNIQIATAATEQSQVSEDVNVNVQRIAENSHETVGVVANAEQVCAALDTQCTKLDKLVVQFKV